MNSQDQMNLKYSDESKNDSDFDDENIIKRAHESTSEGEDETDSEDESDTEADLDDLPLSELLNMDVKLEPVHKPVIVSDHNACF